EMPEKGTTEFGKLKKSYAKGVQLRGKTLGIVGFGRIGQETARIGLALGMNVLPVDLMINGTDIDINLYNSKDVKLTVHVPTVKFDEMLAKSDFISLHVPSVGKALIGEAEFEKMKTGAIIINCSRGGIIDEEALLSALDSGKVAAAGLDVFENEPTPMKALLDHPRISASPHIGASTLEAQRNIGLELADQIIAHFIQ
ncbi:MAG: D-3-phosphoglycerate dehydrogenase, partial [Saprospiraceae bacterium]